MTGKEPDRSRRPPSGAAPPDPSADLESQRALTAEFRQALDAFAEDARRIVRDEVARVAPDPDAIEELVRRVAREEAAVGRTRADRSISWITVGVASLAALAASVVGGSVARWVGEAPASPSVEAVQAAVPATAPEPTLDGTVLAARYDSLFATRDPALVSLTELIVPVADSALTAAVSGWRSGDTAHDPRIHDALVQLSLRETVDSALAVDGRIVRQPACAGASCAALLRLWELRAGQGGYPGLPDDPAGDTAGLALVERLLVMDRVVRP